MNEYEKLGLTLLIVISPFWATHMEGLQGMVLLAVLMGASALFQLGDRIGKKD